MWVLQTARWLSLAIIPLLKSNLNYKVEIAIRCDPEQDELTLHFLQWYYHATLSLTRSVVPQISARPFSPRTARTGGVITVIAACHWEKPIRVGTGVWVRGYRAPQER